MLSSARSSGPAGRESARAGLRMPGYFGAAGGVGCGPGAAGPRRWPGGLLAGCLADARSVWQGGHLRALAGRNRSAARWRGHGVTGLEGADLGPVPAASVARTVNLYVWPARRPLMVVNGTPLVGGVVSPRQAGHAGAGMIW